MCLYVLHEGPPHFVFVADPPLPPRVFTADLWDTHDDCKNWGVLRGHKNAILEVHWTDEGR